MELEEDTSNLVDYHSTNGTNGSITKNTEEIETIDISDYPSSKKKSRHSSAYNKELCKDSKPLIDFINKCLLLDPTYGMEAVINKVLLPSYVKADKEYKESDKFRRVITKAFQRLIDDPARKYTHISDVVDTLKFHVKTPAKSKVTPPPVKKKVNFITLATKVSVKPKDHDLKRPMLESSSRPCPPKKSKLEIIALDCDDDEVIPIDDEVNEKNNSNQLKDLDKSKSQTHKKDLVNGDGDTIEIQDSQEMKKVEYIEIRKENNNSSNKVNNEETTANEQEKTNIIEHEKENLGSTENLLIPHKEKIVRLEKPTLKRKEPAKKPEDMTEAEKARRIRVIEAKIDKCNKTIAKLDLEEVTDDSANSPYYRCDRLRATIVKLYKELCTLVGEEPPKRRKIQLQIKEGVPQGPIKRLEKFLNKQADEEGETPFPDFSDVVRCVEKANEKDALGWSKTQIMKEAQAIFTYCGRALQKKRQQREWKHLRALAVPEAFEADPAETDLELQARLEANRRLASQREAEVFNKFTHMEDTPEPAASTSFAMEETSEHDDSSGGEETELTEKNPASLKESNIESVNNNVDNACTINGIEADVVVKQEAEPMKIQYQGDVSLVINISDSESEDECGVLTF